VFRAQRRFDGIGEHPFFACQYKGDAARNLRMQVLLSFNVSAAPKAGDSVTVRIATEVASRSPAVASFSALDACRATGALERVLAAQLRGAT
jgi:hypothetical protein